jgi:hypothetical protein
MILNPGNNIITIIATSNMSISTKNQHLLLFDDTTRIRTMALATFADIVSGVMEVEKMEEKGVVGDRDVHILVEMKDKVRNNILKCIHSSIINNINNTFNNID